jgi:DNA-binding IclR family transcriptional regulator
MPARPAPPAPCEINYTAQRALRAIEVIAFKPSSATQVAAALGVHARTARRILATLCHEHYAEHQFSSGGRRRSVYMATVRLLALLAQTAPRLPLVEHGRHVALALHEATGLDATVTMPAYTDVLVIAHAGAHGPGQWTLLPPADHAPGRVLLAHREPWRRQLAELAPLADEDTGGIRELGHASALRAGATTGSIAVPVPDANGPPLVALGLHGSSDRLRRQQRALLERLTSAAAQLARLAGLTPGPQSAADKQAGPRCVDRVGSCTQAR